MSTSQEKTKVFSDADHGSDHPTKKSTSGAFLESLGGAIIWSSTKQSNVAQSSCESELYAAAEALKSSLWLTKLLSELNIQEKHTILIDNQATTKLIKNPQYYRRTKHIELKYFLIRDHYDKQEINVDYVPSEQQKSDILTKPLVKGKFLELRKLLRLSQWKNENNYSDHETNDDTTSD